MKSSRLEGFFRKSLDQRLAELERRGFLSSEAARSLADGRAVLTPPAADRIIENVIGVLALPYAVAANFTVNGRDTVIPLAVEEPSIVAALSAAAALARPSGGFTAVLDESLLAGQIHVAGLKDPDAATAALADAESLLLEEADAVHPRLRARGGGARAIEVRQLALPQGGTVLAVDVLVDTGDAMGANLVNTISERLAPRIETITGGRAVLRILSNLADRSLVEASVVFEAHRLGADGFTGEEVRDAIVLASDIATADPRRAATHNKGIMNGVDALAVATGNDWRAIEAGAHAFAARSGRYQPLTRWRVREDGALFGELRMPMKLGIVGGTLSSNPGAALSLAMLGVESARELAEIAGAVGLAQNFAALKALSTRGIQQGHMRLHARSVASAAGAAPDALETVVDRLVQSGEVKDWKAREIIAALLPAKRYAAHASGKVILFGEHAVVYGRHALALPLPAAVRARVTRGAGALELHVPAWALSRRIEPGQPPGDAITRVLDTLLSTLSIDERDFAVHVQAKLPPAMGLGSSAAFAVAVIRAFDALLELGLDDERVNDVAFRCEQVAHGTPSGIDNTVATYGRPLLFRKGASGIRREIRLQQTPPVIVACSSRGGFTREQVAAVRQRYERTRTRYEGLFDEIDAITLAGAGLLERADYDELGRLMNICHGLLNALEVSTPELETMVTLARNSGAVGAKLTGAGGGGSVVALCPGAEARVGAALATAGFRTIAMADRGDA